MKVLQVEDIEKSKKRKKITLRDFMWKCRWNIRWRKM